VRGEEGAWATTIVSASRGKVGQGGSSKVHPSKCGRGGIKGILGIKRRDTPLGVGGTDRKEPGPSKEISSKKEEGKNGNEEGKKSQSARTKKKRRA